MQKTVENHSKSQKMAKGLFARAKNAAERCERKIGLSEFYGLMLNASFTNAGMFIDRGKSGDMPQDAAVLHGKRE